MSSFLDLGNIFSTFRRLIIYYMQAKSFIDGLRVINNHCLVNMSKLHQEK